MILSALVFSALALHPAPVAQAPARIIGCHPHPGKVMGCARPGDPAATRPAAQQGPVRFCHPEPSKNRGCVQGAPAAAGKSHPQARISPAASTPAES